MLRDTDANLNRNESNPRRTQKWAPVSGCILVQQTILVAPVAPLTREFNLYEQIGSVLVSMHG